MKNRKVVGGIASGLLDTGETYYDTYAESVDTYGRTPKEANQDAVIAAGTGLIADALMNRWFDAKGAGRVEEAIRGAAADAVGGIAGEAAEEVLDIARYGDESKLNTDIEQAAAYGYSPDDVYLERIWETIADGFADFVTGALSDYAGMGYRYTDKKKQIQQSKAYNR